MTISSDAGFDTDFDTQETAMTTDTTTSGRDLQQQVLADLTQMIVDVVGEDYLLDLDITMDSSFNTDLEIESIEFVALSTKLKDRYGDRVDFVGWLADKDVDQIIEMKVGELVEYIAGCLSASVPAQETGAQHG
jgi:acyl carrier protein